MSDKPACEGGSPIRSEAFPPWPYFQPEMIDAAVEPLKTGRVNYWTGDIGMKFEDEFAKWAGAKFAVTTSNGTSALHTALAGAGVGPGDEVICTPYSFIASCFCALQANAIPVFADVEKNGHTMDPKSVEAKISEKTKAIVPVHLYGVMCDMDPIMALAEKYNLKVIEDCAQAHGGQIRDKKAGTIGHFGAFSFCQSKHFTTGGEGGAVVTNDEDAIWTMRSFRDHGYDVRERLRLLELEEKLPYIHNTIGFNYRMTEMQSAIGIECLKIFDDWNLANRVRNAGILDAALKDEAWIASLPVNNEYRKNAYWLYPIVMDTDKISIGGKDFFKALAKEGVPAGPVLWPQCYKERVFQDRNGFGSLNYPFNDPAARPEATHYEDVLCENAADVEPKTFFVPTHPTYEVKDMQDIAAAILKVGRYYAK
ncbi:MAG: DegT/DnrJ/EryC1/StrS family aminotransferase [Armatimonadia bacterium]